MEREQNEYEAEEYGGANCGERGHAVRSASAYSAASTRVLPAKYCPVLRGTRFPTWDGVCFPCLSFRLVSAVSVLVSVSADLQSAAYKYKGL